MILESYNCWSWTSFNLGDGRLRFGALLVISSTPWTLSSCVWNNLQASAVHGRAISYPLWCRACRIPFTECVGRCKHAYRVVNYRSLEVREFHRVHLILPLVLTRIWFGVISVYPKSMSECLLRSVCMCAHQCMTSAREKLARKNVFLPVGVESKNAKRHCNQNQVR